MEKLSQAINVSLRDDNATTYGLRTLLGHSTSPFGVYFHHLPDEPTFASKSYLTYHFLPGVALAQGVDKSARTRQRGLSITAWSENCATVEKVLRRARNVLIGLNKVTLPTSEITLHQIHLASEGTDLFDDEFKVYYRAELYDVWYREDITE